MGNPKGLQQAEMDEEERDGDGGSALAPPSAWLALLTRWFEQNAIGARDRVSYLRSALDLDYQPAWRRLHGKAPFTAQEVATLSERLNGSLLQGLCAFINQPGDEVRIELAGSSSLGTAWIHEQLATPADVWMAVKEQASGSTSWVVRPFDAELAKVSTARSVKRLAWEQLGRNGFAVIDDDLASAQELCSYSLLQGRPCVAFNTEAAATAALKGARFDGFVIDWLLSGTTAASLLKQVRASHPQASIVVLTGQISSGNALEDEVFRAALQVGAIVLEKPVRPSVVLANLERDIRS